MAFEGMDVGQVTTVGNQLKTQGDQINNVISAISGLVSQLQSPGVWQGKDASEFESLWNSQHKPALLNAAQAVHGLGVSALNNAQQQTQASNS